MRIHMVSVSRVLILVIMSASLSCRGQPATDSRATDSAVPPDFSGRPFASWVLQARTGAEAERIDAVENMLYMYRGWDSGGLSSGAMPWEWACDPACQRRAPAVLEVLVERLRDESPLVRARSATILGRIGYHAEAALAALCIVKTDSSETVRARACDAVRSIEKAIEMMTDWRLPAVRGKAVEAR